MEKSFFLPSSKILNYAFISNRCSLVNDRSLKCSKYLPERQKILQSKCWCNQSCNQNADDSSVGRCSEEGTVNPPVNCFPAPVKVMSLWNFFGKQFKERSDCKMKTCSGAWLMWAFLITLNWGRKDGTTPTPPAGCEGHVLQLQCTKTELYGKISTYLITRAALDCGDP